MKALGINAPIGSGDLPDHLRELELPLPEPGKGEIRIRVRATSINIDDIHIAEGTMIGGLPVTPKADANQPLVPGTDVAGIVDALGPGVQDIKVGARVLGVSRPSDPRGPWAEYCIVKAADVAEIPEDLAFEAAAPLPLSGTVALNSIKSAGELRGKTCLVIGASGGIGTLCVQILNSMGAEVWTVNSSSKAALVKGLGAKRVLNRNVKPFDEQLREAGSKVDVVFDFVGGRDTERRALSILKPGGKFITAVGPVAWIGEEKLGAWKIAGMFAYVARRMLFSRVFGGPTYTMRSFNKVDFAGIREFLIETGNRAVVEAVVPLERDAIRGALKNVIAHKTAGRVVIDVAN